MTLEELEKLTTEDLMATCQNFPNALEAFECAVELVSRVGPNEYSHKVFVIFFQAECNL